MPRIRTPICFAALVGAGVWGANLALADPLVTETIDYYDVAGATAQEVRADLNRVGPISSVDGKRYDATARWYVSWNYKYKQVDGSCAITSTATTVKVIITFPRLKIAPSTPTALKEQFAAFADKLMLHEKGHAQNGIDIAKRIEDGIRALPPERTCSVLSEVANKLGHALIKEANQADLDYDARTQHGRTQGVKFP